ncbi:MAG: TM0106 family RecB-like putative nuclease [Candidatus Poribacteria bacterium]|nr:TM0106 family RecB-like putative nuclease [Candidatus Poribacteria bacterium]MDE0506912.1 TM0106 family RecB-like putative nuclease [Candidatus Poribacteria bacterium]
MYSLENSLRLTATDLVNYLSCHHLTFLNAEMASGLISPPSVYDPNLDLMVKRGIAHEEAYIRHLNSQGLEITSIADGNEEQKMEQTVAAMQAGAEVIIQGGLAEGHWCGHPDILRRVDAHSQLGDWSYEIYDTKLSRETKGGAVLQLSLYSDLVKAVQGKCPEKMHVVTPGSRFHPHSFRTNDYAAYYRLVRSSLERACELEILTGTYPEPNPHCNNCRWHHQCDQRWRDDDHLCLVAGISKLQRRELEARGISTTEAFAVEPLPLTWIPEHGAVQSYERRREQARIQVEGRKNNLPVFEVLELEPDYGLNLLPAPSTGDVFLDFESNPFVGDGGLEYLLGLVAASGVNNHEYKSFWALSREEERNGFVCLVDWLMEQWKQNPNMHIYHFSSYETGAMKRLMGRYATHEEEVDMMLRAGLFVDLHRVVRDSIRASVESYSIKCLETFYNFQRSVPLDEANRSLFSVQYALELDDSDAISDEHRDTVERYNRDDCLSTLHLRDWLERIRATLIDEGKVIERPVLGVGEASDGVIEFQEKVEVLSEKIAGEVPSAPESRTIEEQARWILANILDWHRRENKAIWWEHFRLAELPAHELIGERAALAGLVFVDTVGGTDRAPVHKYKFDHQETELRGGEPLRSVGGEPFGTLEAIDFQTQTVQIKKRQDTALIHPLAAYAHDIVPTDVLVESILRIGTYFADNGMASSGSHGAARDLLMKQPPRLGGKPIRLDDESALEAAVRIAPLLKSTVLPIQGPPGSGKTYIGARMITKLIHCGKKVGITANSHRVIRNLLDAVIVAADEQEIPVEAIQLPQKKGIVEGESRIKLAKNHGGVFAALADRTQIAGGTAWLWSRPEAVGTVDVLFVDEASQMSLANVLAVSQAADSLVLLGDPQQLEQPTTGTHPDGIGVSALAHLLSGHQTIDEDRGLFLEETWRLHPDVCKFTSEVFYQNKLKPHDGMETLNLASQSLVSGTGLRLVPVCHEANQNSSSEEAQIVAYLFQLLIDGTSMWTNHEGKTKPVTENDVLIVTPYNAQVSELMDRLPQAKIGTVDKFQGQQAPIVIYSMATSAPEDAPRGMEFLYSLNRLNVATSRARCVCVLVASPKLFEPECRTPRQMELANAFCRYRELATELTVSV